MLTNDLICWEQPPADTRLEVLRVIDRARARAMLGQLALLAEPPRVALRADAQGRGVILYIWPLSDIRLDLLRLTEPRETIYGGVSLAALPLPPDTAWLTPVALGRVAQA